MSVNCFIFLLEEFYGKINKLHFNADNLCRILCCCQEFRGVLLCHEREESDSVKEDGGR